MAVLVVADRGFELEWLAGQVRLWPHDPSWSSACAWVETMLRVDVPSALAAHAPIVAAELGVAAAPIDADHYRVSAPPSEALVLRTDELRALWDAYRAEQRRAVWPWVLRRPPLGAVPAPDERALAETWERAWAVVAGAPRDERWPAAHERLLVETAAARDPSPVVGAVLSDWGLSRLVALRRGEVGGPAGRSLDEFDRPENAWPHVFRSDPIAAEPAPGERAWATAICRRVELARPEGEDAGEARLERWRAARGEVLAEAQRIVCAPDARRWLEAWDLAALLRYRTAWERACTWFGRAGLLLGWPIAVELFDHPPPPALLRECERVLSSWRLGDAPSGVVRTGAARIAWRREGSLVVAHELSADAFDETGPENE